MAEARTLRDDHDLKGALDAFRKAHSIMKVPSTGFEVASTLMQLGHYVEAQEAAQEVVDLPVVPKEPEPFVAAREAAAKLAAEAGAKIAYIKLDIKGVPEGKSVDVTIDGLSIAPEAVGSSIKRNPGTHQIIIKGPSTRTFDVELAEGSVKDINVDFTPVKKEEPKPIEPAPKEEPTPSRLMRPLPLIGFGVAGAGIIAGTVTGLMAMSKGSTVKDSCIDTRCPPSVKDDLDSGKTLGTISTISFAAAGVGAVVGVIGYLQDPKPQTKETAGVTPWLGLGQAGLSGRF